MSLLLLFAGASSGGAIVEFDYANERTLTSLVPRHRVQSTLPERAVVNTNPRRTVTYLED